MIIFYVVLLLILAGITLIFSYSNDVFYTTEDGVELTKEEYDRLLKVYTLEDLNILPADYINDIKTHKDLILIDSSEIIVESRTYYDENNQPVKTVHREVSEAEARGIKLLSEKRLLYGWAK